jgi:peptide deformylase
MQEGDERDYLIAVTTGRNKGASATWQETEGLARVNQKETDVPSGIKFRKKLSAAATVIRMQD